MKISIFPILAMLALSAGSKDLETSKVLPLPQATSSHVTNTAPCGVGGCLFNVSVGFDWINSVTYVSWSPNPGYLYTDVRIRLADTGPTSSSTSTFTFAGYILQPKRIYVGYIGMITPYPNGEFRFVFDGYYAGSCRVICQPGSNSACSGPVTPYE